MQDVPSRRALARDDGADLDAGMRDWTVSTSSASLPPNWDAEVAARLSQIRSGHHAARHSHEVVVGRVQSALDVAASEDELRELKLVHMVVAFDYELKTLLLQLLEREDDRVLWQKYLALTLWQILHELPKLFGPTLRDEAKAFKDAVKPVRSDQDFMDELVRIRNGVVAHLELQDDAPGRFEWSVDSARSQRAGEPSVSTPMVTNAITIAGGIRQLGSALLRKHAATFPGA